jgi:hypothetical protein
MNTITLSDLERLATVSVAKSTVSAVRSTDDEYAANRFGDWAGLIAGCEFSRFASDGANASSLPEPQWYALASLLSRCENGLAVFHDISAQDVERYDAAATDSKFAQAQAASAPRTCRSIGDDLGFSGCKRCVFWRHA